MTNTLCPERLQPGNIGHALACPLLRMGPSRFPGEAKPAVRQDRVPIRLGVCDTVGYRDVGCEDYSSLS